MKQQKRNRLLPAALLLAVMMLFSGCTLTFEPTETTTAPAAVIKPDEVPAYSGDASVAINGNVPTFTEKEITTDSYEVYGTPDKLNRCTTCTACVGLDIMPTVERGSIGAVKPTGWHTVRYEGIDGQYLYNRCHLIGYQLTGENANFRNLITGTRYLNTVGMLPYENEVASYVKKTHNHVMYRVTPMFEGDDLVARGVHMMAYSVEDEGKGVSFNVYCYNVQPGIEIKYSTGESRSSTEIVTGTAQSTYILNNGSKKFHKPSCSSVKDISDKNKQRFTGKRSDLISRGFQPCSRCQP